MSGWPASAEENRLPGRRPPLSCSRRSVEASDHLRSRRVGGRRTAGRQRSRSTESGAASAGATWWTPEHYYVEVAGVLRRGELNGTYTSALVADAFAKLTAARLHHAQVRPLLAQNGTSGTCPELHGSAFDAMRMARAGRRLTP